MKKRKKREVHRGKRVICLVLSLCLLLGSFPALAAPADTIRPGETVTGTLRYGDASARYALTGVPTSYRFGLRLEITANDDDAFDAVLMQYENEEMESFKILSAEDPEANVTVSGRTLTYESGITSYDRGSWSWTISVLEYNWADKTGDGLLRDRTFTYSFTLVPESDTERILFGDVRSTDWYHDAVYFAYDNGLFQGVSASRFAPGANMTRGMFATVLGRRAGISEKDYPGSQFSDVGSRQYYAPFINWACEIGVVQGVGGNRFAPDANITRQDMVTMLYRYVRIAGGDDTVGSSAAFNRFSDRGSVASYARDAMIWAINKGYVSGVTATRISPRTNATRAQVAQIFMKAYDNLTYEPDGEEPPEFEKQFEAVSDAIDRTLDALLDGQSQVFTDTVMAELYDSTRDLERAGVISDLESTEEGIFFTYGDGTPGGIIMDLSSVPGMAELDTQNAAALSTAQKSALPAAAANAGGNNVIGNRKVLFLGAGYERQSGDKTSRTVLDITEKLEKEGFDVTRKPLKEVTVADYATFADYGVVILNSPYGFTREGIAVISLEEESTFEKNDIYRDAGYGNALAIYCKISPQNPTPTITSLQTIRVSSSKYTKEPIYALFPDKFFSSVYNSGNPLPNTYIHLGYNYSGSYLNTTTVADLIRAGAGCVGSFGDKIQGLNNLQIFDTMLDVLLKKTDNTMAQAMEAVKEKELEKHQFSYTYYKNDRWELEDRVSHTDFGLSYNKSPDGRTLTFLENVITPIPSGSLLLELSDITWWDIYRTLSSGERQLNGSGVQFTVKNIGNVPVTAFTMYFGSRFNGVNHGANAGTVTFGHVNDQSGYTTLMPGQSWTFSFDTNLSYPAGNKYYLTIAAQYLNDPPTQAGVVLVDTPISVIGTKGNDVYR